MKNITLTLKTASILLVAILSGSCKVNKDLATLPEFKTNTKIIKDNLKAELKPMMPPPAWGPTMKQEMRVVIEKLTQLQTKPIETLDAPTARQQPTPTDAVMAVMSEHGMKMPVPMSDTIGRQVNGKEGSFHVRIYTPKAGTAPYPVVVYYHGGGFVIANTNVYNSSAQMICELTGAVVVSVDYPRGPEHKFPAAHDASFGAYQWAVSNAASFKGDASKIAVAGESAGGNLAANVCLMARDRNTTIPLYAVLVYPVANNDMNDESYNKYASAKPLNKPMMQWFVSNYLHSTAEAADPRISLVKANLKDFPDTLIIAAEIDPLQTEGKLLADKLKDAGANVDYKLFEGVTHEFFGMGLVVPQATKAEALAAGKLRKAFGL